MLWSYLERAKVFDIDKRLMPLRPLVVGLGPDLLRPYCVEVVDVESHGRGGAMHVVPELQAQRASVRARSADQTRRVAMGHTVTLDIHIVAL